MAGRFASVQKVTTGLCFLGGGLRCRVSNLRLPRQATPGGLGSGIGGSVGKSVQRKIE